MSPAKPTYQPNQIKYLSFSVRTKLGLFAALLFLLSPKEVDMRLIGNKFSLFDNTFSFKSQHLVKVKFRISLFENIPISKGRMLICGILALDIYCWAYIGDRNIKIRLRNIVYPHKSMVFWPWIF